MSKEDAPLGGKKKEAAPAAADAPAGAAPAGAGAADPGAPMKLRRAKVLQTIKLRRHGGTYVLREGKEITSDGYDFDELIAAGAKIEELK